MRKTLQQLWILLGLAVLQLVLTTAFQTVVPWAYLVAKANDDAVVADGLRQLEELGHSGDAFQLEGEEMEQRKQVLRPLFERIPWAGLALLATSVIYPFLGFLAGRLCDRPELAGVLILFSVLAGQNPATSPMGLQHMGMGEIGLSFFLMVVILILQFFLLACGIYVGDRGQLQSEQGE